MGSTTCQTSEGRRRPLLLSQFEVAKVVGVRALELAEGSVPKIHIHEKRLLYNLSYIAALELHAGVLDMQVRRGQTVYHISDFDSCPCLDNMLDFISREFSSVGREHGRNAVSE